MLTLLSHGEVAHSWPRAGCQWSPLPPGLTAKGEVWKLLLYSNYLALSSLFQAPAGESGTGNSRRETPYSPSNQQVRLLPGQAIRERPGGMLPGQNGTRAEGQRKLSMISILESDTFEVEGYPSQEATRELGEELCSFKMSQRPRSVIS